VIACDDGRLDAQAVLSDRGMFAIGMNEARPLPALRPHSGLFANGKLFDDETDRVGSPLRDSRERGQG